MELFISDLHLDPGEPERLAGFSHFCLDRARRADRLWILGDLFEAWPGDDHGDAAADAAREGLSAVTASGTRVLIMPGNRDFLLGAAFAASVDAALLVDPHVTTLAGIPTVLAHGDALCTRDEAYMALRAELRDPGTQQALLARPLSERRALAAESRQRSLRANGNKPEAIMDVTSAAVEALLRETETRCLIHGHTHRPADHRWIMDGEPARRMVLGAWERFAHYAVQDAGGLHLRRFRVV